MSTKKPEGPFRIGRSDTGLGLFATDIIDKGAFIIEYVGPRITSEEVERRRNTRYLFEINSRWTIDGSPRSNIARYANHACKPNAEATEDRGRVFLRARRRIEPGEEITYDYGRAYFELFFAAGGCRCAACAPPDGGQKG